MKALCGFSSCSSPWATAVWISLGCARFAKVMNWKTVVVWSLQIRHRTHLQQRMWHGNELLSTHPQIGTKLKGIAHLEAHRILIFEVLHIELVLPFAMRNLLKFAQAATSFCYSLEYPRSQLLQLRLTAVLHLLHIGHIEDVDAEAHGERQLLPQLTCLAARLQIHFLQRVGNLILPPEN